jgi:hypothetical protein
MATHTITEEATTTVITMEGIPTTENMPINDPMAEDTPIEEPKVENVQVEDLKTENPQIADPTAKVKTTCGKRRHPDSDSDTDAPDTMPPTRALLLHMCTLLECREAITAVVRALLAALRPEVDLHQVTDEAIRLAFTNHSYLPDIINSLGLRKLEEWEVGRLFYMYRDVHSNEGLPRFRAAPGAMELLKAANKQKDIGLVAVLAGNPISASPLLGRLGFGEVLSQVRNALHPMQLSTPRGSPLPASRN